MKRALVCGAGGFIGGHLVQRLKSEGFWVRGVDIKHHEFAKTAADEFVIGDLRDPSVCESVVRGGLDEVYQLAAGFAAQTCFMARQVTEKALKAALLATGAKSHRGHSCARLGVKLVAVIAELEVMRPDLMLLDQYYVATRYPNGIPSGAPFEAYSLSQTEQALESAARACDLTRVALNRLCPAWEASEP